MGAFREGRICSLERTAEALQIEAGKTFYRTKHHLRRVERIEKRLQRLQAKGAD